MNTQARMALNAYNRTAVHTSIEAATPHRLIQMLMEGALDKMSAARGLMEHGRFAEKGKQLGWAISIIGGLRASLDKDAGGDLANNLDDLYEYMTRRLYEANRDNDIAGVDEVTGLLREIKSAWDAIGGRPEVMQHAARR